MCILVGFSVYGKFKLTVEWAKVMLSYQTAGAVFNCICTQDLSSFSTYFEENSILYICGFLNREAFLFMSAKRFV